MITAEQQRQVLEQDLSRDKFIAWLNLYEDRVQVGLAGCPAGCPIARYLMSNGHKEVSVDMCVIQADRVQVDFPQWIYNFIYVLDGLASNEAVTRAMALQFLTQKGEA